MSERCDIREHNRRQRQYYESGPKRTMVPSGSPYLRRHVEQFLRFTGISPGDRVLEVGCGMGRYTLLLAERGIHMTGLDLSPVLLDELRAYNDGRYRIRLYCADILQPPEELRSQFDAAIGLFALHHFHDMSACVAAMTRLLKERGCIAFLEPNAYSPLYYVQMAIKPNMTWQGDKGIARMRRGYVCGLMREAGLTDIRTERFGFFPPMITNMAFGPKLEALFERFPLWRPLLPFQLFRGTRP